MQARYWSDTNTDNDRKRRRQAEFLVHNFFPLRLVEAVGVRTRDREQQGSGLLEPRLAIQTGLSGKFPRLRKSRPARGDPARQLVCVRDRAVDTPAL